MAHGGCCTNNNQTNKETSYPVTAGYLVHFQETLCDMDLKCYFNLAATFHSCGVLCIVIILLMKLTLFGATTRIICYVLIIPLMGITNYLFYQTNFVRLSHNTLFRLCTSVLSG